MKDTLETGEPALPSQVAGEASDVASAGMTVSLEIGREQPSTLPRVALQGASDSESRAEEPVSYLTVEQQELLPPSVPSEESAEPRRGRKRPR